MQAHFFYNGGAPPEQWPEQQQSMQQPMPPPPDPPAPPPAQPSTRDGYERVSKRVFVVPADATPADVVEELNSAHNLGVQEKGAIQLAPAEWADDEIVEEVVRNDALRAMVWACAKKGMRKDGGASEAAYMEALGAACPAPIVPR